jgi:acyl-CoA thioesterase-2
MTAPHVRMGRQPPESTHGEPALSSSAEGVLGELVHGTLALQAEGGDIFVGSRHNDSFDRIYGGELAAQALCAASFTVRDGYAAHSEHVSFLRTGDPTRDVRYTVQRLRDSSLYSTRAVTAAQGDRLLATMTISFQGDRDGLEHAQLPAPGRRPDPISLMSRTSRLATVYGGDLPMSAPACWPIDIRYIDHDPWDRAGEGAPFNRMWLRADGTLPDDPGLHRCVLAYASDLTMFEPIIAPHGGDPYLVTWDRVASGGIRGATLDHTVWFHRPFRADEWLLHEQESPVAHGSRGLTIGRFFTTEGLLVATAVQEAALLVNRDDGRVQGGEGGRGAL